MTSRDLHHRLHSLIGERFRYVDELWVLIEILHDADQVVLRRCTECAGGSVQRDAFGVPSRRVMQTLSLRISDAAGDGYSEDLLVLLEGRQRPAADG